MVVAVVLALEMPKAASKSKSVTVCEEGGGGGGGGATLGAAPTSDCAANELWRPPSCDAAASALDVPSCEVAEPARPLRLAEETLDDLRKSDACDVDADGAGATAPTEGKDDVSPSELERD